MCIAGAMSVKPELPPKPSVTPKLKPPLPPKPTKPQLPPKSEKVTKHRHSISFFRSSRKSKQLAHSQIENITADDTISNETQLQTVKITCLAETDTHTRQSAPPREVVPLQMATPMFDNEFTEEVVPIVDKEPSLEVALIPQRLSTYEATMVCDIVRPEQVVQTTNLASMETGIYSSQTTVVQESAVQCHVVYAQGRLQGNIQFSFQMEQVQEVSEESKLTCNLEPLQEYHTVAWTEESNYVLHGSDDILRSSVVITAL